MAVKRVCFTDEDGLENGPVDDSMSSSESAVTELLVGGEDDIQSSERTSVLSTEVKSLLRRTSRIMRKKGESESCFTPEPLVRQLYSLRKIVPYSSPNSNSCIISDALRYLDQLSKKVDVLQRELAHVISPSSENPSKVDVMVGEGVVQIHVSCQKRPGLMADLLTELERLGMVFQEVTVSSHDVFILDAVSTQVEGMLVHADVIKKQILRTIFER